MKIHALIKFVRSVYACFDFNGWLKKEQRVNGILSTYHAVITLI